MQEYVFKKEDLKALMAAPGDTISIRVIFQILNPGKKEFMATVEAFSVNSGAAATSAAPAGGGVKGCPNPPSCD